MKYAFLSAIIALLFSSSSHAQNEQPRFVDAKFIMQPSDRIYVNQTIELMLKVRPVGVNIGQDFNLSGMPDDDTLMKLEEFKEVSASDETLNGVTYKPRVFRCRFRPLKPGKIQINAELGISLLSRRKSFFGANVTHRSRHTVKVDPFRLVVSNIPQSNVPDGFENAVGELDLQVMIEPAQVDVGELVNITSTVRGDGYLDDISSIGIESNNLFRVYPSQLLEERDIFKSFRQTIVVKGTNSTEVPAVSFSFFDPKKGVYRTITRGPFPLTFRKAKDIAIEKFQPKEAIKSSVKPEEDVNEGLSSAAGSKTATSNDLAVLSDDESMYFAPSHASLTTAEIPGGKTVRILDKQGDWYKIEYQNNRGWIPAMAFSEERHVNR
ncbi:hypothetical protein BVX97_05285 [bacterium E08(2017)]|nr:hypothetical protein BVX97_05285 [bacterium E08(2017)]